MAINRLTRRGPFFGADPEVLATIADNDRTAEDRAEIGEAVGQLKVGLARLKTLDRLTLEAFYLRGRSLKQMAREFDVPTGTIKRRLHVARLRLKEELEENDPTLADRLAGAGVEKAAIAPVVDERHFCSRERLFLNSQPLRASLFRPLR